MQSYARGGSTKELINVALYSFYLNAKEPKNQEPSKLDIVQTIEGSIDGFQQTLIY